MALQVHAWSLSSYGRCTADVMRRDRPLVSGKRKTSRTLKDEYNKEAEKASIEILRFGLVWGRRGPVCLRAASCPGLTFRRTMTHHNEPAVQRFQGGTAIDSSVQDRPSSKGRWQRCHFKPRRHWFTSILTKLQLAFCSQLSPMDFGLLWQAVAKCRPISFLQAVNAVWSGSAGGSGGGKLSDTQIWRSNPLHLRDCTRWETQRPGWHRVLRLASSSAGYLWRRLRTWQVQTSIPECSWTHILRPSAAVCSWHGACRRTQKNSCKNRIGPASFYKNATRHIRRRTYIVMGWWTTTTGNLKDFKFMLSFQTSLLNSAPHG